MCDELYEQMISGAGEKKLTADEKKGLVRLSPFKPHVTREKDDDCRWTIENETGKEVISLKMKNVHEREPGKNYIPLIGAGNKEVPRAKCPEIGNGSIIRCKVWAAPYYMAPQKQAGITIPPRYGISLKLSAIKLLELKEYTGGNDDFGDDEGYSFDEEGHTPENDGADF